MKCIKNVTNGQVRRVSNETANEMVTNGNAKWAYCAKSEWKQNNPVPRKHKTQTEVTD